MKAIYSCFKKLNLKDIGKQFHEKEIFSPCLNSFIINLKKPGIKNHVFSKITYGNSVNLTHLVGINIIQRNTRQTELNLNQHAFPSNTLVDLIYLKISYKKKSLIRF